MARVREWPLRRLGTANPSYLSVFKTVQRSAVRTARFLLSWAFVCTLPTRVRRGVKRMRQLTLIVGLAVAVTGCERSSPASPSFGSQRKRRLVLTNHDRFRRPGVAAMCLMGMLSLIACSNSGSSNTPSSPSALPPLSNAISEFHFNHGQALTCSQGPVACEGISGPMKKPECPILVCAAPPDGCHYEGTRFFPCKQQTCGNLVCDGGV